MLTAETAIIQRLTDEIAAMNPPTSPPARVCSSAAIAGQMDLAQFCPLVVVHPARADGIERGADDLVTENQVWRIVLATKSIPDTLQLTGDHQAAGVVIKTIVRALEGFEPGDAFNALRYVARLEVELGQGFVEFPLEFRTRFALSTVPAAPTPDSYVTHDQQYNIDTPQTGEPVAEDTVILPQ